MQSIFADIRYAIRGLLSRPAFSIVAILTLALGIGANTAIFSVVNGVVLQPLQYPGPERLMFITSQFDGMVRSVLGVGARVHRIQGAEQGVRVCWRVHGWGQPISAPRRRAGPLLPRCRTI